MVKKRVIPCLDVAGGRVVKGVNFVDLREMGEPIELATRYSELGADELVFLDITATLEGRGPILELIERAAAELTIPFTVGGGVTGLEDARSLLRAGADKVARQPRRVRRPVDPHRARRRVRLAGRRLRDRREGGGGLHPRGQDARAAATRSTGACEAVARGAGELLVTSIDADGTRAGYDLPLTARVRRGGRGARDRLRWSGQGGHLADAFAVGAEAAIIASIVHERPERLPELKAELREAGWNVRI